MAVPTVRSSAQQSAAQAVHAVHCLHAALPAVDRADPWLHQLAASLAVEARTLAEFKGLMQREGFRLEMSRLFLDLVYAYRQLAIAHSLGIPRLRTLSLELFEACQRLDQRRRDLSARGPAH
jgi:ABC-type Fe3+ transport system permease subunit